VKKNNLFRFSLFLIVGPLFLACSNQATTTPDALGTSTMLSLGQTMAALDVTVQAHQAAQTEAARATETPLPSPTFTPPPTATPGPVVIQDDFSTDTGRWIDCGQCKIENGVMQMGPYPISNDGGGYIAICKDCGQPQDYKMGIDATFVDGYTDRGFGLLLREENGNYFDVEITTWQVYGAWAFDNEKNLWGSLLSDGWKESGSLYPSAGTNRLEVEIQSAGGTSNVHISINGQLVNTASMPAFTGRVGLVVGLHSLGVRFDNFYFEGYPLIQPGDDNLPEQSG